MNKESVEAYNNAYGDKNNKKKPYKKKFYKKNNVPFIVNTVLKIFEIAILTLIWYELYLMNLGIFD